MSDVMFYGVLRMPFNLAMADDMGRIQFYDRAQEAADRVEAAEKRAAELQEMVCKMADALAQAKPVAAAAPATEPVAYMTSDKRMLVFADALESCGHSKDGMTALYAAPVAAAVPGADDNGCKSCAILRRYEKTARERGYAMGKAAGNNELAQVQELLAFERTAHAETNAALTAEITRLEALLAAAPAQEPAAWICIYDDGEVDYTPLRELAEAAPKAIPLYRSAAPVPVGAQEVLDESAAIIIKQSDRIAELKAQLACFEQDPNLRYNVPEDGGPITSYYVAPAASTEPTDTRAAFEKWANLNSRQAWQHKDGSYKNSEIQARWEAWQAAKGLTK